MLSKIGVVGGTVDYKKTVSILTPNNMCRHAFISNNTSNNINSQLVFTFQECSNWRCCRSFQDGIQSQNKTFQITFVQLTNIDWTWLYSKPGGVSSCNLYFVTLRRLSQLRILALKKPCFLLSSLTGEFVSIPLIRQCVPYILHLQQTH